MSAGYDLFTRWQAHKGFKTASAAATYLGISEGSPSNWKHGRSNPDNATIETMADDLKELAAYHILMVEADRKRHNEPERRALMKAALRIAKVAAIYVVALLHSPNAKCGIVHNVDNATFDIKATSYTFTQVNTPAEWGGLCEATTDLVCL